MYNHAPPGYECSECSIVAGEVGDNVVVTESEHALAIVSRRVWASGPGHALVVPKTHYENLYDLEDPAALDIHRLTRATGATPVSNRAWRSHRRDSC